jgi:CO/xanthine dehydrogenase FAD-binding subunit
VHNFGFIKPNSLQEVSRILAENEYNAKLVAGCTDVIPALRKKIISPEMMVSMKGIPNLSYITEDGKVVRIGAGITMTDVSESELIRTIFPALATACENVGSRHIQNSATVVGNLCNASPAADTAPPILAYKGKLTIFNQGNEREVDLSEFFVGPGKTILRPGDVVKEIILPLPKEKNKSVFIKQGKRKALEISILNVAVNLSFSDQDEIIDACIACGAVGPTPILAKKAAEKLIGLKINSEVDLNLALEVLSTEVSPISDIRSTAEYRRHMVVVLTKRAILSCCGKGEN